MLLAITESPPHSIPNERFSTCPLVTSTGEYRGLCGVGLNEDLTDWKHYAIKRGSVCNGNIRKSLCEKRYG
ncbi:hypothetical protein CDAR_492621 [Caerostris darwini]|uniref:Uncharacterized protein n=1 Tax=Caerostris darwini TaxID=1538125 RepID=A0AAV4UZ55_9ARAC|nr:hypothetical protein CDAR_492621 [Caerostris darwini]